MPYKDKEKRRISNRKSYLANREKNRKKDNERAKEWHDAHPEFYIAYRYKYTQGEPIENKIARLEAQDYKCANQACLKPIDITSGHQDHNHETGQKRGVLCGPCNHALGLLKDNVGLVMGLAAYRSLS
jgi:hypothetical protein